ncbi:NrsF family protein [Pinisolibacter sp.]|uniref:NrsF family protein n=1 Tax=Pinisolibacter sp. TaxID=2172024 RepID=UPI002FDDA383
MRTDDFLGALIADGEVRPAPLGQGFVLALLGGTAATAALFFATIGPRPDIASAAQTLRFLLKFVECAALAAAAFVLVARLVRPGAAAGFGAAALIGVAALLAGAVVTELLVVPSADWGRRLVGTNWYHCLALIPILSIAPFAALMIAARHGAPTRPHLTGAVVGLVSAGIGAFFYAANCTDDSPLFVATWYTLATALVAGLGAAVGGRVLRW